MAYEKPITIREAINAIADDEYLLPAIQREFVWNTEQIETLFDSLMRDYPISTFLFWKVKAENIAKFKFYRFLKNYHERDERHNQEASLSGERNIIAILDGQQRLTSIYLALRGSYAAKLPYHRVTSNHAYPKKWLHLNLLRDSTDITMEYDFKFLTEEEASTRNQEQLWVPVGKVLEFNKNAEATKNFEDASEWVSDLLEDFSEEIEGQLDKEVKKAARRRFSTLFRVICERETVNFFLEQSEELDKVLQIFIRINQGGTQLSYSDLLLSIATAQWKTLDARKEIHEFVDRINDVGRGFNFNKDFVLKSCLVLAEIKDVAFKVDNFSSENMETIEAQWDEISNAISLAVRLAAHFGFDDRTLTSANAMIPIAFFLKEKGIGDGILNASGHKENRARIKQWLIRALLKRHFGGTPDNLYPIYRKAVQECDGAFPLDDILDRFSGTSKSMDFYQEDIENLLSVNYGSAFAFMLLSLFYPLQHDYEFHQDHIHPKKHFTRRRLVALGIDSEEKREAYLDKFNHLPNLQLLQATPNIEKGGKMFHEWLTEANPEPSQLRQYKELHLIPAEESLAFGDFLDFYEAREELLRARLKRILNVKQIATEDESS